MKYWYQAHKMNKVRDQIWIGGSADAEDTEALRNAGITCIANLTDEDFGCSRNFDTLQLNQLDQRDIPHALLDKFFAWMDERIDRGEKVLIHCHAGISRTPSFLIAWHLHRTGCNSESDLLREWSTAEDFLARLRPIIQPHYALKRSIIRYFSEKTGT